MRLPFPLPVPFRARPAGFEQAIQQLRDGRVGESGYGRRIALLLTIPTFEDPVARDVRRAATGELYVVRTVWQRALDLASERSPSDHALLRPLGFGPALPSLRPSLVSKQVAVDIEALDALLGTLTTAMVPCHVQHSEPPLDATIFELTLGDELTETRYRWAAKPPDGWTPLATFASRLVRLVDDPGGAASR
jgi:hypothetical protein